MSIDYAIEWAYGEFRIARMKGKEAVESWKSPTAVSDFTSLGEAMSEAAHHIDISRGGSVAIAYEDDLHTHEFLEMPPLSKRDMQKFLQRHVEHNKAFDGAPAWRAQKVNRGGVSGVLLHLMPKEILDAVMRICEEFYLLPKMLVPLTEVISEYVPLLEKQSDSAMLLIALFDDRTQMLVSSDDGEILFVRELSYPWSRASSSRLIIDINRTIGYAKQKIGGSINQAWVFGESAKDTIETIGQSIDALLTFDEEAAEADFWTRRVAALPQSLSSNFIPLLARRAITGKTFVRAGILMSAVTAAIAVIAAVAVEVTLGIHSADQRMIQAQISRKNEELLRLGSEVDLMNLQKTKLDILNVDAFNLPALFLSHLTDLVPEGLVLTQADVIRGRDSWEVLLRGKAAVSLGDVAPLLSELQSNLTGEPWNTVITSPWEAVWMQQLAQGLAVQSGEIGFEVRGQLR